MTTLQQIEQLCRRYNSPAVNPGAHALANRILRMIDQDQSHQNPSNTDGRTEADGNANTKKGCDA